MATPAASATFSSTNKDEVCAFYQELLKANGLAASAHLLLSMFAQGHSAAILETFMIFSGIFFVALIQTICEYQMDAQWLHLMNDLLLQLVR